MYFDRKGEPIELDEWVELLGQPEYKRVAGDIIGPYWVSTVWLGLDHGWGVGDVLIFETMVFGDDLKERGVFGQWRYETEEEALRGHALIANRVRELEDVSNMREALADFRAIDE